MNENTMKFQNPDYKSDENTKSEIEALNKEGKSLAGSQLKFANLKNADLVDADLKSCDLTRADLSHASMYGANLEGANLFKANLENANLKDANLTNCKLLGANLTNTKLDNVSWGDEGKIINELEAEKADKKEEILSKYKEAEEIYRSIKLTKQNQSLGEEAGNMFIREMVCKRKQLPKFSFFRLISKFAHITTGYGERINRILTSFIFVIISCSFLFGIEGVSYGDKVLGFFSGDYSFLSALGNLIYFSVIVFSTVGFGEITPFGPLGKSIAIFEGLIGGIIITILIIAIYRRMMDR